LLAAFPAPASATITTSYLRDAVDGRRDLNVMSDAASEPVVLACNNSSVTVNAQGVFYKGTAVPCGGSVGPERLTVAGQGGNDHIDLTAVSRQTGFTDIMDDPADTPAGNEVYVSGGDGADVIAGSPFGEYINQGDSGGGPDIVHGGAGKDEIQGTDAADRLYGDGGKDIIQGLTGADLMRGGTGNDSLVSGDSNTKRVKLYGDAGADQLFGGRAGDLLDGGSGGDTIYGRGGKDRIYGRAGNDGLYGEGGADVIFGNAGNDYIRGGPGKDKISPGPGKNNVRQ
jgi:Ca2+-binding RTX toxin-like protein